ncbi:MAG: hypothetical protein ACI4AQ_08775 [Lachnospiraceae bacterium]
MKKVLCFITLMISILLFNIHVYAYERPYTFTETILFCTDNYALIKVNCSFEYSDGNWSCTTIDSTNAGQISAEYYAVEGENVPGYQDTVESVSRQYFDIVDSTGNVVYSFYIYFSVDIYGDVQHGHVTVVN